MAQKPSPAILLRGGLNIVSPAIAVKPGMAIAASNYEADVGGYRRTWGYERFSGVFRPSEESYWILFFDQGTAAITTGQVVNGETTSAQGLALQDAVVTSGSYGGGDAAGWLLLSNVTLTFLDNENIRVGGVVKSVANGTANEQDASTDALHRAYLKLAADTQRALISAVPGEGDVLGVCVLNGDVFAIRNNVGSTAAQMYRASYGSGGWMLVDLGSYIKFDGGTVEFLTGLTVTGGTSGNTAVILQVVLLSGAWSGTAAGLLVLSGPTGNFIDNEALTASTGAAVANGTRVVNTLPAGGRYDFTVHNFYGAGKSPRMYAVNGVGRGFEWSGVNIFTPLFTGLSDTLDKPTRIGQFAEHLFLGFDNGYGVFSEPGTPVQYKTTAGAGDFNFGHDFTDILESTSTAMILLGDMRIGFITGKDKATFSFDYITDDSGSIPWTAQSIGGKGYYLDDKGVRTLTSAQEFGSWRMGTITQMVEPIFKRKQDLGVSCIGSVRVRATDHIKFFFDDRSVLSVYFGRKDPECMLLDIGHDFTCFASGNIYKPSTSQIEARESIFAGGADGYVYELERGTSFDGDPITAYVKLGWNNLGSPAYRKRYHGVLIELATPSDASLVVTCDFEYGNPDLESGSENFSIAAGGGLWNAANWNEFIWSASAVGQAFANVDGIGTNISPGIISDAVDDEQPHTLSSMIVHYSDRGMKRGA